MSSLRTILQGKARQCTRTVSVFSARSDASPHSCFRRSRPPTLTGAAIWRNESAWWAQRTGLAAAARPPGVAPPLLSSLSTRQLFRPASPQRFASAVMPPSVPSSLTHHLLPPSPTVDLRPIYTICPCPVPCVTTATACLRPVQSSGKMFAVRVYDKAHVWSNNGLEQMQARLLPARHQALGTRHRTTLEIPNTAPHRCGPPARLMVCATQAEHRVLKRAQNKRLLAMLAWFQVGCPRCPPPARLSPSATHLHRVILRLSMVGARVRRLCGQDPKCVYYVFDAVLGTSAWCVPPAHPRAARRALPCAALSPPHAGVVGRKLICPRHTGHSCRISASRHSRRITRDTT